MLSSGKKTGLGGVCKTGLQIAIENSHERQLISGQRQRCAQSGTFGWSTQGRPFESLGGPCSSLHSPGVVDRVFAYPDTCFILRLGPPPG
jgi:hypothetical protein